MTPHIDDNFIRFSVYEFIVPYIGLAVKMEFNANAFIFVNIELTLNVITFMIQIKANATAFKQRGGDGMQFKNLRAEMARENVTIGDIAEFLGVRFATVSDKMNGRSPFKFSEATKIRKKFFPKCSLEYLFDDQPTCDGSEPILTDEGQMGSETCVSSA